MTSFAPRPLRAAGITAVLLSSTLALASCDTSQDAIEGDAAACRAWDTTLVVEAGMSTVDAGSIYTDASREQNLAPDGSFKSPMTAQFLALTQAVNSAAAAALVPTDVSSELESQFRMAATRSRELITQQLTRATEGNYLTLESVPSEVLSYTLAREGGIADLCSPHLGDVDLLPNP